jgi:hypothetical protein
MLTKLEDVTSCLKLIAVEGCFAQLTRQRHKRRVFHSVVDLQAVLNCYIAETNPPS